MSQGWRGCCVCTMVQCMLLHGHPIHVTGGLVMCNFGLLKNVMFISCLSDDSSFGIDDLADQISMNMTINSSDVGKVIGH